MSCCDVKERARAAAAEAKDDPAKRRAFRDRVQQRRDRLAAGVARADELLAFIDASEERLPAPPQNNPVA